jgi:hypothetical protein
MPEAARAEPPVRDRSDLLHDALAAVTEAKSQLQSLETGQERAREKSWAAASAVEEAQSHLNACKADERRRLASAWVADDTVDASPIPAAEHELTQARQALENIRKVEAAIASEIPVAQRHLRDVERAYLAELAEAITRSEEYQSLCQAHNEAWTRLRSVRAALAAVNSACGGAMPNHYFEAAQRGESLSLNMGASVDQAFIDGWKNALDQMSSGGDLDVPLPST